MFPFLFPFTDHLIENAKRSSWVGGNWKGLVFSLFSVFEINLWWRQFYFCWSCLGESNFLVREETRFPLKQSKFDKGTILFLKIWSLDLHPLKEITKNRILDLTETKKPQDGRADKPCLLSLFSAWNKSVMKTILFLWLVRHTEKNVHIRESNPWPHTQSGRGIPATLRDQPYTKGQI